MNKFKEIKINEEEISIKEKNTISDDENSFKWYILQTYNAINTKLKFVNDEKRRGEKLQSFIEKYNMQKYFNEIFIPIKKKKDCNKFIEVNCVTGYIFIHAILNSESKKFLMSTNTGYLMGGSNPKVISDEEINILKTKINDAEKNSDFYVGEVVKIIHKDFLDFDGVISDLFLKEGFANVVITIFGRNTTIKFKLSDLEKIE